MYVQVQFALDLVKALLVGSHTASKWKTLFWVVSAAKILATLFATLSLSQSAIRSNSTTARPIGQWIASDQCS
jgi:hypothetical protein